VGERCAHCGAQMRPPTAPNADKLTVSVPGLSFSEAEPIASAPVIEQPARHRKASAYLSLQPSEQAVLAAASRIFAGFVASGAVTEDNQNEVSDRSVRLATRMALVIEKYVQSDNEDW
jgi:hypothetical protein